MDIADIGLCLRRAPISRIILVEGRLAALNKLHIIRIASFGYLHNSGLGKLLQKLPLLLVVVELLILYQLQLEVLFEEERSGEEVEVGRREEFGGDDDADLGHIDGKFEDQVGQCHEGIFENEAVVGRHAVKRVPDDGIVIPELVKILSFLEVDVAPILEQTGGELGVGGDLLVEDAELAEDLIDEMVVGQLHLELLGCIACE